MTRQHSTLALFAAAGIALAASPAAADERDRTIIKQAAEASVFVDSLDDVGNGDTGSGFFIDSDGHFITANHTLEDLPNGPVISVTTNDGQKYPARLVHSNDALDYAVLRIDIHSKPLCLGDFNQATPGDDVLLFGYPFGLTPGSGKRGIVSAVKRNEKNGPIVSIQYDAATNPGDSGGPIIDKESGCVIGIAQIFYGQGSQNSGVSFAVPMARILADLRATPGALAELPFLLAARPGQPVGTATAANAAITAPAPY